MAAQIHMAGRICTSVSRQLVKRSFTPWKSMAKAPTSRARGANQRLRRLSASTVRSTMASSPVRMATTNRSDWARMAVRREASPVSTTVGRAGSGTSCEVMMVTSSGPEPQGPVTTTGYHPTRSGWSEVEWVFLPEDLGLLRLELRLGKRS